MFRMNSLFFILWIILSAHGETPQPIIDKYPLMGSPLKVLSVTILYWLFVKKIGPKLMENRKAFELKNTMLAYNALQVLLNGYLFCVSIKVIAFNPFYSDWSCMRRTVPAPTLTEVNGFYAYYIVKVTDYMDTIIMVLRKRNRQITFLHVYHHILMVVCCYAGARFITGGHVIMIGVLNSVVHVVMYAYYFLAALRPDLRNSVSWKKYITQMQMAQFIYLIFHFLRAYANSTCDEPKGVVIFGVLQSVIMMILFSNFYYKAYINTSPQKAKSHKLK